MSTSVIAGFASNVREDRQAADVTRDRVLVTAFDSAAGRAIASAFADTGARLVLQTASDDDTVAAAAGRLSARATGVSLHTAPLDGHDDALAATRAAIRALGGIDAVVVVTELSPRDLVEAAATGDVEQLSASTLAGAIAMIRVAANRMGLTWTEGALVIVLVEPEGLTGVFETLAALVKTDLATLVRREAERFAGQGIRVNAIHAAGSGSDDPHQCIPALADLATRLARRAPDGLTGLVFQARTGR